VRPETSSVCTTPRAHHSRHCLPTRSLQLRYRGPERQMVGLEPQEDEMWVLLRPPFSAALDGHHTPPGQLSQARNAGSPLGILAEDDRADRATVGLIQGDSLRLGSSVPLQNVRGKALYSQDIWGTQSGAQSWLSARPPATGQGRPANVDPLAMVKSLGSRLLMRANLPPSSQSAVPAKCKWLTREKNPRSPGQGRCQDSFCSKCLRSMYP
jgi:hypothetical protein